MANEFVIKNGFFSQGTSNVTGNLTVTQTISGTTGQFTQVTASFSGNGASLTSVTASAINDTTSSFSISNVQDGQYLKRSGNSIVGSFMLMAAFSVTNETNQYITYGTANDTFAGHYAFSGTAVLV